MNSIPNVVWPILIIVVFIFTVLIRAKTINFWRLLVFQPIWLFILHKSGFFDQWLVVHYIWATFYILGLIAIALTHGKEIENEFGFNDIFGAGIALTIFYFGGAFKYLQ
jgi:hypothetical protein